jgi:RTX calcium-binding nonapeptide repeat (4 copies)
MTRTLVARAAAVAVLTAAGAGSAWAASIHGTTHADVLHGTKHADVLYGLAGNDKLYGLAGNDKLYGGPGNDVLVGGPGADLLDCGPGRDTAIADQADRVVRCEVVKRTSTPPPPPLPPPPPTTTTATTTTVAAPTAQPGHYCGFTNNGGSLCFDITAAPEAFANAAFTVTFDANDCDPPAGGTVDYTTRGSAALAADNSFDFEIASGDSAGTFVKGKADASGNASGDLHIHSVLSSGGTTFTCGLNATWTATRQ